MARRRLRMLVVVEDRPKAGAGGRGEEPSTVQEAAASPRPAPPSDPSTLLTASPGQGVIEIGSSLARGSTFEARAEGAPRFRSPAQSWGRSIEDPVRLGRFEILGRLGAGGMGEVFVAQDGALGRKVALKLVRSDIDTTRGDATARIIREAQLMARVVHPNVVRIYDVAQVQDRVYITMELVEGSTLRGWLTAAEHTWREIVGVFVLAGRGLAAAHAMGLVHRDFKPTNVLIGDDGRVMVADFGLARAITREEANLLDATERAARADAADGSGSTDPLTSRGAVLGTPGYMSPEQLMGEPADARSDVFSFCVALYEALYGVRPFAGDTRTENLANIEDGALVPPRREPKAPKRLGKAIRRGLKASPDDRFPSMEALLGELDRALSQRTRSLVGAAMIGVAGLLAGAAFRGEAPDPCAAAAHELDDAWGSSRREAIAVAFAATEAPYAADASARAIAALDEYAGAWTAARVATCEAREVRLSLSPRAFDLEMICLGRGERALRALVEQLARADAETVEEASAAIASLPEVEGCGDLEELTLGAPPPAPELTAEVEAARREIALAEALYATGHNREGLTVIEREAPRVTRVGYAPAIAEAELVRGRLLGRLGVLDQAEEAITTAIDFAEGSRHDGVAADAWLALVSLTRLEIGDLARAEALLRRARAAGRRIGEPKRLAVRMLLEEAKIDYMRERYEAADAALRAATTALEGGGGDDILRSQIAVQSAGVADALGRVDAARDAYDEAIELAFLVWGPGHPDYARIYADYGLFLMLHDDLGAAREVLEDALSISEELGPTHQVNAYLSLASLALREGDFREAEAEAEAGLEVADRLLPEDNYFRVLALDALATARYFLGDYSGAIDAYSAARAIRLARIADEPLPLAEVSANLAETYLTLGRLDEAEALFVEVERCLERSPIRRVDLEARALAGRGRMLLIAGSAVAAVDHLEAALKLLEPVAEDPMVLGELHGALAEARARRDGAGLP